MPQRGTEPLFIYQKYRKTSMANSFPMTTQDIMDAIHVGYEQAQPSDGPAFTDDDGIIRLNLINKGIVRWWKEDGVKWRELFASQAVLGTLSNSAIYPISALADFDKPANFIILTDGTSYETVPLINSLTASRYIGQTKKVAWITGNASVGYNLNLGWTPAITDADYGYTIKLDYFKYPQKMGSTGDIPEMSDPTFLVAYGIAELFVNDDVNLYTKFSGDALNALANMRTENDQMPAYASDMVEDQGDWVGLGLGV